ncbi:MAG: hypothetical protein H6500_02715 [Candidatus Woesearchaeota archaeon]|nr:MAG: hypothetical protein H6500_02715 [Candidatus Woesearchaeota archaeon]
MAKNIYSGFVMVFLFAVLLFSASCSQSQTSTKQDNSVTGDVVGTGGNFEAQRDENVVPGTTGEFMIPDGTYTDTGRFMTPAGENEIEITLSVKDGIIETFEMKGITLNKEASVKYFDQYQEGISSYVIGKPLANLEVPAKISGSSLTSKGVQSALDSIKTFA